MNTLLKIENLHARIGEKEILRGIDLSVRPGEVHAIMGPNGSGKSTLSAVLAGRETFEVTEGTVTYDGRDLLALSPEERSWAGIFLGFQYPVEIPGVSNANFMKAAVNAQRKQRGLEPIGAAAFLKLMREKMAYVEMDSSFSGRGVNVGFSGGEKKRNEIFQMAMLEPSSTRPTPVSTWTPCASSPPASTGCAAPTTPSWSSPTTSGCSTTSFPT